MTLGWEFLGVPQIPHIAVSPRPVGPGRTAFRGRFSRGLLFAAGAMETAVTDTELFTEIEEARAFAQAIIDTVR